MLHVYALRLLEKEEYYGSVLERQAVLTLKQMCRHIYLKRACECCQFFKIKGIPLCVCEALLQSGEGFLGPGGDSLFCGLCLSTEGGVWPVVWWSDRRSDRPRWGRCTALCACLMLEYTWSRVFSPPIPSHHSYTAFSSLAPCNLVLILRFCRLLLNLIWVLTQVT